MHSIPITPLGHLLHAAWPLVVLGLLIRFARGRGRSNSPWCTRTDLGLAAACGLLFGVLSAFWMARYFITNAAVTASDFSQYCESIGAFRDNDLVGWNKQRSVVAGWLPSVLAGPLGLIDGLLVGGLISCMAMGSAIYLWARALHGRLAGLSAAILACAAAPLVQLTRTASFYPEAVAAYVLSGTGAVLALRYRSLPALLAAGVGVGLVLLVDVRGLIWALPALGLSLLAALGARLWWRKLVGLVLVLLPVALSHPLGSVAYFEKTPSLEQQAVFYVDEAVRRVGADTGVPIGERAYPSRFIWGWSPMADLPKTIQYMVELNSSVSDAVGDHHETVHTRQMHVLPWLPPALVGLLLAAWGARRRPWILIALVGASVPFVVALKSATTLVSHPRYVANGMAIIPIVLGVGLAVLAQGSLSRLDDSQQSGERPWGMAGGVLVLVALVLGIVPSWLSPTASWRSPIGADSEPQHSIEVAQSGVVAAHDVSELCVSALRSDYEAGALPGSGLYGWTVPSGGTP
jgi:hypothetical protein